MTKPSTILLTKQHPLEQLPERELEVVRRFLFGGIRGLDDQMDARWRRFWSQFIQAEVGQVFELQHLTIRAGNFHRRHMAMEQRLFQSQERYSNVKHFRNWLKTGAGWGEYQVVAGGRMKFTPWSTAYEHCSDDEMRQVHIDMVAFLRTNYAQRKLWPHLTPAARSEMLELIVEPPERETT